MKTGISDRKLKRWISVFWLLVILIASTYPKSDITIEGNILLPHVDKVAHFIMYFILQLLLMWQLDNTKSSRIQFSVFLFVNAYGFILELIQKFFLVDRFFESYDIIANITGAFGGIIFFHLIKT